MAVALAAGVAIGWSGGASAETVQQRQWHLGYLKIADAQRITTGRGVTVAVIDSGVDAGHPDLSGQVRSGTCASNPGPGSDQRPTEDFNGHGTQMAGLIVAKGGAGALGIAPNANVMPICVDDTGAYQEVGEQEVAQGIRYATDHGATVINVSLGGPRSPSTVLEQAVGYALTHDVVVVAAAGNVSQGDTAVADVARIPGVVAVTGVGPGGSFWSGSVQGPQVAVAGPAVGITSTDSTEKTDSPNTDKYVTASGTSGASAIVSGVVALIRSKYPHLDAINVINRLVRTADDNGPPGRDPQYGFGVVDPVRALTAAVPSTSVNPLGAPSSPVPTSPSSTITEPSAPAAHRGGSSGWLVAVVIGLVAAGAVVGAVLVARMRGGKT